MSKRRIAKVFKSRPTVEGAGVHLKRAFGYSQVPQFDPFLMLDDFHTSKPEEYLAGFPWHPHRGIETITYVLEGLVEHGDSMGNKGAIGAGDVQWMTAGSGIIHQEMPQGDAQGRMHGFQLWANLPAALKMTTPRYQEVNASTIPSVEKDGATVRVVTGQVFGANGPVTEIAAQPLYIDVTLAPGAEFVQQVPQGHTAVAYVFEGAGSFDDGEPVEAVHMVLFGDGDTIRARTSGATALRFMLIAGAPFKEKIVPYGPFVMNTVEEIQQTLLELRNGTFIQA